VLGRGHDRLSILGDYLCMDDTDACGGEGAVISCSELRLWLVWLWVLLDSYHNLGHGRLAA